MPNSSEEMKERIGSLSDEDLVKMIEVKFRDYTPEAIKIAKEIAQSRSVAAKQRIADAERQQIEEQQKEAERERGEMEKRRKDELSEIQRGQKDRRTLTSVPPSSLASISMPEEESELLIRKRHKAIRALMRVGNFIGWFFCITIIGLPIGLSLLYLGHLTLASIETEHNTREMASLLREYTRKK
jgi:hypothetical protein